MNGFCLVAGLVLMGAGANPQPVNAPPPYGFLTAPAPCKECKGTGHVQSYQPKPGDLIFYTCNNIFIDLLYACALTGGPHHVGIVVQLPDGRLFSAESGAWTLSDIKLIELQPRLRAWSGKVHVRRLCHPLTPEQSRCLTEYALNQTTKAYARFRVLLEATPFRAHGPIGSQLFGSADLDRSHWACYEFCVACVASIGLIDANKIKPNTVYVRDLFNNYYEEFSALWEPPAVWAEQPLPLVPPGEVPAGK